MDIFFNYRLVSASYFELTVKATFFKFSFMLAAIPIGFLMLKTNIAMKKRPEQYPWRGCVNLRGGYFRFGIKIKKTAIYMVQSV